MTPAYPLSALLGLRAREEQAAGADVALALGSEAEARRRREACAAERDRLAGERRTPFTPAALAAGALQARARFDERRRRDEALAVGALSAADEGLARALAAVASAREELARAARARDAVERHRASWDERRRRARERAEDGVLDDLAAARFARGP